MIKVGSFFYQELVPFIKRIYWRTLSWICHTFFCSSCSQVYNIFKYKYYSSCLLGVYFLRFSQLLQCSFSGFLFLQCSAFGFLNFVLLIWGCAINLSDLFLILILFCKLLASLSIQSNPQIFRWFLQFWNQTNCWKYLMHPSPGNTSPQGSYYMLLVCAAWLVVTYVERCSQ